jgi:choline kinase/phosphohistidine swiveling domain-containing protein
MTYKLFLLGAGKPAIGKVPSALKNITNTTKAIDWQLRSFSEFVSIEDVHFLGGYHIEEVIDYYPKLNFTLATDWANSKPLDTLLKAPFSENKTIFTYSDTIFRNHTIKSVIESTADITVCIDSSWRDRYKSRESFDIENAEIIHLEKNEAEFTGLICLSIEAIGEIKKVINDDLKHFTGDNLISFINYLATRKLSINYIDVKGEWAEFNSPDDISNFVLGTKADTLSRLEPLVKKSKIGSQKSFTKAEWLENEDKITNELVEFFGESKLVVRSSSSAEDNWESSNAGGFESILDVPSFDRVLLKNSIEKVFQSYGSKGSKNDQVLVQEFISNVAMAGVVFTCSLETGAPYYKFNFDDKSSSTESVTSGNEADLRTVIVSKLNHNLVKDVAPELSNILSAVIELEDILGFDKLDIEFAVDKNNVVHIFQVRPVVVNHDSYDLDLQEIRDSLNEDVQKYKSLQEKLPFISGNQVIFSNMPDWNPAEIIGTRPKPLSLSLYQELITNNIWAKQRAEFGYKDVRPYPLIYSFSSQPYVDVRASFNSFIPSSVPDNSADRIVNAYLKILCDKPYLYDKVEFDIVFTVWTHDFLKIASERLHPYGVTNDDLKHLEKGLKNITADALIRLNQDIKSTKFLHNNCNQICNSSLSNIDKIFFLLDDCKKNGTLAFSHAARAGFVASTLLKSFVTQKIISEKKRLEFLSSFDTVAGIFDKDKQAYKNKKFLLEDLINKYGHLRPGTYDITAKAYWEDPSQYLLPTERFNEPKINKVLAFTSDEKSGINKFLIDLGTSLNFDEFVDYLKLAIQERERVKFEFSRNLSRALDYCVELGKEFGLDRSDMAYLKYCDLYEIKVGAMQKDEIVRLSKSRKEKFNLTKIIELPALIKKESNFFAHERYSSQPNFIGIDKLLGDICVLDNNDQKPLKNKIVVIPQADPGYDWLFGQEIAGLITKYGGANSHMAIRSAEIGLPAVIGVGEKIYEKICKAESVEINCLDQILRVIR